MLVRVCRSTVALFLLVLLAWLDGYICETHILLQTITGSVPLGNFTYYKLTRNGNIRFVMWTLEGDADVYLSQTTMHPTYNNYDIKSATFGVETLDISETMKRPVGIGIYGHPFCLNTTTYKFDIILDTSEIIDPWHTDKERDPLVGKLYPIDEEPEKESLLWSLFIGILKVALDIMI